MKPIALVEYGFPACDRATNQPNVFFDPKSSASATPYWSIWDPIPGGGFAPRRDDALAELALEAIYEYWNTDGHSATSAAGVVMVDFAFSCAWAWDARPFPTFPLLASQWADANDWATGNWLSGRGPALAPACAVARPDAGRLSDLPDATDARLVDAYAAAVRDRRRRPCFGPRDAATEPRRGALRHRTDLRTAARRCGL